MVLILYDPDLIRKDPSDKYLFKQLKTKSELIFVCYQEEIRGVIGKIMKYGIKKNKRDKTF